ncbi:hypothetical protein BXO88_10070 [Oribacterium sp. C9]|uniref:2-hydroxyacyl-CoA dehydratase subunit D n=1 Tax=Oribacterium sp. C9 TaxID=1943579 RepID=UPI0009C6BA5F|nr:2-hydroxyacyl-CoA dehydratase family protein [Oribacterium sp. C9]OON85963.1 hypothetical protein BXO88_10070 [Oribacterium sp. C9]
MGIHECALKSRAFNALKEVYDHRSEALLKERSEGKKVLGELGCDVPDELVIAAGMLPVRIYADSDRDMTEADKYLEYAFEPVVRAQFEKLVDGTYSEQIDYLAISNSTDIDIRIFLYLRELKRVEPEKPIVPITFIDWLFTRNRLHQERNEFIIGLFRKQLEEWAGHEITDVDILKAADICNKNRAALRRISALRHGNEVRITGSEALVIIGAGLFMDREKHTELVNELSDEARGWPVIDAPRVYYTGANQEDLRLYEMIESKGLVIVGEDTDFGERYFNRDFNLDYPVIRGIVDRYMLREFSAKKATPKERMEALEREVEAAGAQAVVFYTNIYDEVATWDIPKQIESLERRGIKHIRFEKMLWPAAKNEGLEERLGEFAEEMRGGRS